MTLGSHQRTIGVSQVHITPRRILDALGSFDLDPCGADPRPWDCAAATYTVADDGLTLPWHGRVWLNPPFDRRVIGDWFRRMAAHDHGTALVHARTETEWFRTIWRGAAALLFLSGRVIFHKQDGSRQTTRDGKVANSGAPVVLAAFGFDDAHVLSLGKLDGQFVPLIIPRSVVVLALEPTWRELIGDWLRTQHGPVAVADLYRALEEHPKTRGRAHWREKARQTLLRGAGRRVSRDRWVAP